MMANIIEDNMTKTINGTYLLLFNTEITVNNIKYVNPKGLPGKTPEAPNIPKIEFTNHKEILSIPYLHELT